jgi:hypothetical protein
MKGTIGAKGMTGDSGVPGIDGGPGGVGPIGPIGPAGDPLPGGGIAGQLAVCTSAGGTTPPPPGALVHVVGRAFTVFTGANGAFSIDVMPPAIYDLSIHSSGQTTMVPGIVVGSSVYALPYPISLTNTSTDRNHCGTCGNVCGTGLRCAAGVCVP